MATRDLSININATGNVGPLEKMNNATDNVKKSAEGAGSAFEKMGKGLDKASKTMNNAGKKLTAGVTAPLLAIGTAGTKMAFDLEEGIKKITTLADDEILPVSKIESEVRAISDASGIAQNDITEAVYGALSAGVESADVMSFVEDSVDLTKAGFTDMATAIDATTTIMNAYGDEAFDVGKIHDIMVNTQDEGKISVDELGSSIGRVIPTASALNINMDELGASYAILTKQGQNANLATTNMNRLFSEMSSSGSKADEILQKVAGKGFKELIGEGANVGEVLAIVEEEATKSGLALGDIFGDSAKAAAEGLSSVGTDGYDEMVESMNNATGKTSENAEAMEGDMYSVQVATNKVKNVIIDLGGVIAPVVGGIADKVSELVEGFSELDDETKEMIIKIGGIALAIGPLLMVGAKVVAGVKMVGAVLGFIMSPIGLVVAGVALIVGGLIYLWNTNETFREKVTTAWEFVSEKATQFSEWVSEKMQAISDVAGTVTDWVSEKWDSVTESFQRVQDKVSSMADTIQKKWQGVKDFMKNPIKGTVEVAQRGIQRVRDRFSHADGAYNIPYNNYPANLHEGEMVLTKDTSDKYRSLGGTEKSVPSVTSTSIRRSSTTSNQGDFKPTINIYTNESSTSETVHTLKTEFNKLMKQYERKNRLRYG